MKTLCDARNPPRESRLYLSRGVVVLEIYKTAVLAPLVPVSHDVGLA